MGHTEEFCGNLAGIRSYASLKPSLEATVTVAVTLCADCQPPGMQGLGLGQEALSILRGFGLAKELNSISLPLPTEVNTAVCPSGKLRVLQRDDDYNHRRQGLQPLSCHATTLQLLLHSHIKQLLPMPSAILQGFRGLSRRPHSPAAIYCMCSGSAGRLPYHGVKVACIMVLN